MSSINDDFVLDDKAANLGLLVNMNYFGGGYSTLDKFGFNPGVTTGTDPEDVWEGGGLYTFDANDTAPIISVASDNSGDTGPVSVQGLDIKGKLTSQTITLTGITRVELDTPLWRVFRMQNLGTTDLSGTVFCYTGTGTVPSIGDPEVRAIINDGNNQTLMAIYTVPAGKVGFLYRGEVGMEYSGSVGAGKNFARCQYQSRRYGGVFQVKKVITLISDANSNFEDRRVFPDIIPALTDIKINVQEVSEDMGIWATFDMILVDEEKFSRDYLNAIGQPVIS